MTKTAGHLGVQQLVAHCLNPSCRHEGLIDVSKFADDIEVTWFAKKAVCAQCGTAAMSTCAQTEG
ncbi:MAG: hypothetical protein WBL84_11395 [Xanthobacteraceae bacterium]|jgi:hypothetical protein